MKYDPAKYETVKQRKKRFYADFPDGRISVELASVVTEVNEKALIKAYVYLSREDQEKNLPRGTGYAYEERVIEKSISRKGEEYESVNYTSWVENCEESAIGRALDNSGYAGNDKCSRDEMEKANRMESNIKIKKEKLDKLPEEVKTQFRTLKYTVDKCYTFCDGFGWDEGKIKQNLNLIIDAKVASGEI